MRYLCGGTIGAFRIEPGSKVLGARRVPLVFRRRQRDKAGSRGSSCHPEEAKG
ncbi:MAG: hypothetical protein O7E57_00965 [Gammaproteobacteria bacterium]|nr:hypothetical protein [Gammaproteobacteria bacterium]